MVLERGAGLEGSGRKIPGLHPVVSEGGEGCTMYFRTIISTQGVDRIESGWDGGSCVSYPSEIVKR